MTQSRNLGRLLTILGAVVAAMALLAPAASATEAPAEGYERFNGCPDKVESTTTTVCQLATITGGNFKMGSKNVPISKPITLSGGINNTGQEFKSSPTGGLAKVPLEVPGGVIGITGLDWLINFLNAEALKLYAQTELVGTPKLNPTAFSLPVRAKLINPVLGNKCFVGSEAEPIQLNLTTGTTAPPPPNEPITGKAPKFGFGTPAGVSRFSEGKFVDNAFAAPAAKGCVLTLLGFIPVSLDAVVNSQAGLPSPAGTNETIQEFELELVSRKFVYP
jgi:hypothetical protein